MSLFKQEKFEGLRKNISQSMANRYEERNYWFHHLYPIVFKYSENANFDDTKATFEEWYSTGEQVSTDDLCGMSHEGVKATYNVVEFNGTVPNNIIPYCASEEIGFCLCSHWIVYHCIIENLHNGNRLFVGTECIKRFETDALNKGTAEELAYVATKINEFKAMCEKPDKAFKNIITPTTIAYIRKYKLLDEETCCRLANIGHGNAICSEYLIKCDLETLKFLITTTLAFIQKVTRQNRELYPHEMVLSKVILENTNLELIKEWFTKKERFSIEINTAVDRHVNMMYYTWRSYMIKKFVSTN